MLPRESVLAALNFTETQPLPYTLFMEDNVGQRLDQYYGSPNWREQVQNAIAWVTIPPLGVRESFGLRYTDPFGAVWRTDRRPYHL